MDTWKAEFYPVGAKVAAVSEEDAVLHSLRKWTGLRKVAMDKHGVSYNDIYASVGIGEMSCALCLLNDACDTCELARFLGASASADDDHVETAYDGEPYLPCDVPRQPFSAFLADHDPEPMIKALEKVCGYD